MKGAFPLAGTEEFFEGVAVDVAVAGIVVEAGVGTGGEGDQLVVRIVDGDGRVGFHFAAEDAGEAVGEVSDGDLRKRLFLAWLQRLQVLYCSEDQH